MDYIEIERTIDELKCAVIDAKNCERSVFAIKQHNGYRSAISKINTEFERLREYLGY